MQALINADGSGRLFANSGVDPLSWAVCAPDLSNCAPFATGREISTAGAPPNTVFLVAYGGKAGISPVWRGNVASLTPPAVSGEVRANRLVTPLPGTWSGGWDGESSKMEGAVCATPGGEDCITLNNDHYPSGCAGSAAVLDPAFVGDYLFVRDSRIGPGPHPMTLIEVLSPYQHLDSWTPTPASSVAMVGRIAPATGPRTDSCGPPPLNQASIHADGTATVECGFGCRAVLIVKRGKLRARATRRLARTRTLRAELPRTLKPTRRALRRLGSGRARVLVRIDGLRAASRTVKLRPLRRSGHRSRHDRGRPAARG